METTVKMLDILHICLDIYLNKTDLEHLENDMSLLGEIVLEYDQRTIIVRIKKKENKNETK